MYLKPIILFFCMTLYVLQCQGVEPNPEERLAINRVITSNVGQDGKVAFIQLRKIINDAASALGLLVEMPGVEKAQLELSLTNDEVEIYALAFLAEADEEKTKIIKRIVEEDVGQDFIGLDELKDVFNEVAKENGLSQEFTSIDVLQRDVNRKPNPIFDMEEVKTYALAYIASEDPKLSGTIKDLVSMYRNPNGINTYENFKNVIDGVKREMKIPKLFYTYDEFKAKAFGNYQGGKFTVDQVEEIVITNLFRRF